MKLSNLLKSLSAVALFSVSLLPNSTFAQTAQQMGEMYNQCSHPNYQGDPSRCGGGGSYTRSGAAKKNYFYVGIAKTPDGRRVLLDKRIVSYYQPEENKARVAQEVLAKCNGLVGGGCTLISVDENVCVSVASNPATTRQYGYRYGFKQCNDAQQAALQDCQQANPTTANQCKITETVRSPSAFWELMLKESLF